MTNKKNALFPIILITSLFFLWGFAHNLDPILIPHLKRSFTLTTVQATLIDTAVYAAYFLMALPAGYIMKRFGYKTGIITGLLFFATGCYLFIPAANTQLYPFFLVALFIIACGLATLETVANPYMTVLGDPAGATQRLNFAQSFNGFATTIAPFVGTELILIRSNTDAQLNAMSASARKLALAAEASTVKLPYFILGSILVIIAIAFSLTKLPKIQTTEGQVASKNIFHALKNRHLTWGVIAQFFYVGAQTCVLSLFVLYAPKAAGITEKEAGHFASACGLAFLIGRFVGTFLMRYFKSENLLAIYAIINVFLCIVAIYAHGMIAIYTVIGIAFFMSIMFPTIFALGIKDLKGDREFGSSLIIMSIVGGAIIPRAYGYISDATNDIQMGYFVPLVCFIVIAVFGISGHKVKVKPEDLQPSGIL
jgi:FHS family L-fucose permease-like MFS transporter